MDTSTIIRDMISNIDDTMAELQTLADHLIAIRDLVDDSPKLSMPDVIGEMIQDFIRPDLVKIANKKKMDKVVNRIMIDGENIRNGDFHHLRYEVDENSYCISEEDWERLIVEQTIDPAVEVIMRRHGWSDEAADNFFANTMTVNWLDNMDTSNLAWWNAEGESDDESDDDSEWLPGTDDEDSE